MRNKLTYDGLVGRSKCHHINRDIKLEKRNGKLDQVRGQVKLLRYRLQ
jgi:hypothetical protein